MATNSPASPLPEGYMPLDHEWKPITPDPPVPAPTIMPDPPVPAPTITPDPPALSKAYALLDQLFPAPPDLPKRPYNLTWKPLKPNWSCLLGPGMVLTPVMPMSQPASPHPDKLLLHHQKTFLNYQSISGSCTPSPSTSRETSLGSSLLSTQGDLILADAACLNMLATLCTLLTNALLTCHNTEYDLD